MDRSDTDDLERNSALDAHFLKLQGNLPQCDEIRPLQWANGSRPRFENIKSSPRWEHVPVLNYMSRRSNWKKFIRPIFDRIDAQLSSRPETWNCWQITDAQLDFVKLLSEIIAGEMGWPNDHFVPNDPLEIVLSARFSDGGEIVHTCARLERKLGVDFFNLIEAATRQCETYGDCAEYFWKEFERARGTTKGRRSNRDSPSL